MILYTTKSNATFVDGKGCLVHNGTSFASKTDPTHVLTNGNELHNTIHVVRETNQSHVASKANQKSRSPELTRDRRRGINKERKLKFHTNRWYILNRLTTVNTQQNRLCGTNNWTFCEFPSLDKQILKSSSTPMCILRPVVARTQRYARLHYEHRHTVLSSNISWA